MADTATAGAMPADASIPTSALDEADADLADANSALQGLLALLRACDPDQPLAAGQLRGLLQPIAGAVDQAAQALAIRLH